MNIERPIPFTYGVLDRVLPMHLMIDGNGIVNTQGQPYKRCSGIAKLLGGTFLGCWN